MDSKALAKSKRAHSLHHSKKQPHSSQKAKPKAPVGNVAGSVNKAVGKQARERARQSGLPSNWDRYEDEFDSDTEGQPSGHNTNKASDVILPKSKGADYRHLISEAQSQCQSDLYLDTSPLLDDIFPGDFKFGVGPMLSARGEGILSWIGHDNFVVEDESAVSSEAHFLSLNLNALAEQLAKVDVSDRLFIEADLLPLELTGHGTKANNSLESDQMQRSETQVTSTVSEEPLLKDTSKKREVAKQSSECMSSGSTVNGGSSPFSFNQELDIVNQSKVVSSVQEGNSYQNRSLESSAEFSASSVAGPKKQPYTIDATAAEAELDMLLDSFGEAKFLDSSGSITGVVPLSEKKAPRTLTVSTATRLDDELDDLLEETSNLSSQNNIYKSATVPAPSNKTESSSSRVLTKSKVVDDFDS